MDSQANTVNESARSTRLNIFALGLLTIVASVVGIAPAALALDRPDLLLILLLIFAVEVFIIAVFSLRKRHTRATESLGLPEFLLGGLGAIYFGALNGLLCLVLYGLIFGIVRLITFLVGIFGKQLQWDAATIALYPTAILALLFGLVIVTWALDHLIGQLYPDVAGLHSAFYSLVTQQRRSLWSGFRTALVILAVIILLTVILPRGPTTLFYVVLQLYFFFFSMLLFTQEVVRPVGRSDAGKAIGKLLQASGYHVESSFRTGDSAIDPLLVSLDLFAYNDIEALVVDVESVEASTEPVDWTAASSLLMKASALGPIGQKLGVKSARIKPLMVLVGRQAAPSLQMVAEEQSIRLVEIKDQVISQVLQTEDQSELETLARLYLAPLSGSQDPIVPLSTGVLRGGETA